MGREAILCCHGLDLKIFWQNAAAAVVHSQRGQEHATVVSAKHLPRSIVVIGKKNARRILCLHCHCYMIPGGLLFPLSEDSELPPRNKQTNKQTSESFNKTHERFSAMCQELAYKKNLSALTDRISRKLRMSCGFSSHEFQIFSVGTPPPQLAPLLRT
jgi:hypothetical protein